MAFSFVLHLLWNLLHAFALYLVQGQHTHTADDRGHLYFRLFVMCTSLPLNTATRRREPLVHMAHFGFGRKSTPSNYARHSLKVESTIATDLLRVHGRVLSLFFWSIL
jgi:hypothetical protein